MSKENNGGPAFARSATLKSMGNGIISEQDGMTLRDYFAAKALQGMVAATQWGDSHSADVGSLSAASYAIADAMLSERAK